MNIKNHVMIDLETLGLKITAPIISIGAVRFNIRTAEFSDYFHQNITTKSALKYGKIEQETVDWWEGQDDKVKKILEINQLSIEEVMNNLTAWLQPEDKVWGNGSLFDIGILEHYYNGEQRWKYYDVHDMRTMEFLGTSLFNSSPDDIKFVGDKHNALDDAMHQAKYVSEIYRNMYQNTLMDWG